MSSGAAMIFGIEAQSARQAERLGVFAPIRFPQEQNPLSGYAGGSQRFTRAFPGVMAKPADSRGRPGRWSRGRGWGFAFRI